MSKDSFTVRSLLAWEPAKQWLTSRFNLRFVAEGRGGHYSVPGMRERAKRIGGKLDVWTETGAGTEVELSVPGSIAYGTSAGRTVLGLFRKK